MQGWADSFMGLQIAPCFLHHSELGWWRDQALVSAGLQLKLLMTLLFSSLQVGGSPLQPSKAAWQVSVPCSSPVPLPPLHLQWGSVLQMPHKQEAPVFFGEAQMPLTLIPVHGLRSSLPCSSLIYARWEVLKGESLQDCLYFCEACCMKPPSRLFGLTDSFAGIAGLHQDLPAIVLPRKVARDSGHAVLQPGCPGTLQPYVPGRDSGSGVT